MRITHCRFEKLMPITEVKLPVRVTQFVQVGDAMEPREAVSVGSIYEVMPIIKWN